MNLRWIGFGIAACAAAASGVPESWFAIAVVGVFMAGTEPREKE